MNCLAASVEVMDLVQVVCSRCNKPLKTMRSSELGFGPVCYKKHKKELADIEFEKNQLTIWEVLADEQGYEFEEDR